MTEWIISSSYAYGMRDRFNLRAPFGLGARKFRVQGAAESNSLNKAS